MIQLAPFAKRSRRTDPQLGPSCTRGEGTAQSGCRCRLFSQFNVIGACGSRNQQRANQPHGPRQRARGVTQCKARGVTQCKAQNGQQQLKDERKQAQLRCPSPRGPRKYACGRSPDLQLAQRPSQAMPSGQKAAPCRLPLRLGGCLQWRVRAGIAPASHCLPRGRSRKRGDLSRVCSRGQADSGWLSSGWLSRRCELHSAASAAGSPNISLNNM